MYQRKWLVGLASGLLAVTVAWAADPPKQQKQNQQKKPDQAGKSGVTPQISAHLRLIFNQNDANKDGYLDTAELARAFRGPTATPAPDVTPESPEKPGTATGTLPDQIFLQAYDKDKDGKVSFPEYEEGVGPLVAEQLKQMQELQKQLTQIERQLGGRPTEGQRRNLNLQRQRVQQEMQRLNRNVQERMRRPPEIRRPRR